MPYKTGKLKGKITGAEIRKLIRAHNVLVSIKIPPKTDRDGLIDLIKKNGFKLDEVKGEITGTTRPRKPKITLAQAKEITKPKEKTELQKQQLKQKKEEKMKKLKDEKEKEKKAIKKEGVKEFKKGLKKAKTTKPKEKKKVVDKKVQEKKPNVRQLPPKKPHDLNKKKVKKVFKPKGNEIKPPQQPKKILSQTPAPPTRIQAPAKKDATPPQDKIQQPKLNPRLRARKELKETGKKEESKKVQENPDNFEIIQVKSDYPINVELYNDIKNIPAGDVFNNLVLKKSNIFYPWTSLKVVAGVMFYHILKDNKSTCALPRLVNNSFQDSTCKFKSTKIQGAKAKKDDKGKLIAQNTWKCRPVDAIKKISSIIARRFLECSLNDDALPLTITKDGNRKQTSTHANMLLLNPVLMTAEHFEPHGGVYKGSYESKKGKFFVPPQSNLNPAVKEINESLNTIWLMYRDEPENLKPRIRQAIKKWNDSQDSSIKKPPQLKYENMAQTCPSKSVQAKMNGYQSGDLGRDKTPKMFEGVLITEIEGYCSMWSLFHLDLRLKTLRKKSSEVYTDMIKLLSDKKDEMGGRYIELMRGMSRYAWEQLQDALKNPKYNEHGATKEEFIRYLNKEKFPNAWKVSDAIVNMKMDLANKYVMEDEN